MYTAVRTSDPGKNFKIFKKFKKSLEHGCGPEILILHNRNRAVKNCAKLYYPASHYANYAKQQVGQEEGPGRSYR